MCCGRRTFPTQELPAPSQASTPAAPVVSSALPAAARFEYIGETALTVVSPLTGKKYRFRYTGDSLEVDVHDQFWLPFVPNLRRFTARNNASSS